MDVASHLAVAQSYVSEVEAGKVPSRQVRVPFDRLAKWLAFLDASDADRLAAFRLVEQSQPEASA